MNAFEGLCKMAATHHFCWHSPCTTCANHDFRVGLVHIAIDRPFPERSAGRCLWPWPDDAVEFSVVVDLETEPLERLVQVLADANLDTIRGNYKRVWAAREDWLGYLGVVLIRIEWPSGAVERFTRQWRMQLNEMVGDPSLPSSPVTFEELELYETRLLEPTVTETGAGSPL